MNSDYKDLSVQELVEQWDAINQETPKKHKAQINQVIRKIAVQKLLRLKSEA